MVRILHIPAGFTSEQSQRPSAQDFRTPPPSDAVQRALSDLAGTLMQFRGQSIARQENALDRQQRTDLQTQGLEAAAERQAAGDVAASERQQTANDAQLEAAGYDAAMRQKDAASRRAFDVEQSDIAFGRELEVEGLREGYRQKDDARRAAEESAAARVAQQQAAFQTVAKFEADIDDQYRKDKESAQRNAPPGHVAVLDDASEKKWAEINLARQQVRSINTVSPQELGFAMLGLRQQAGALHWTTKPDQNVLPNGHKVGVPFVDPVTGNQLVADKDGKTTVLVNNQEAMLKVLQPVFDGKMDGATANQIGSAVFGPLWKQIPDTAGQLPGASLGGLDSGGAQQQSAVQSFDATSQEVQSRWSSRQREVADIVGRNYSDPELLNVVSDELHSAPIDEFFKMATQFGNVNGVPITQWMADPANRRLWTAYNATKRAGK